MDSMSFTCYNINFSIWVYVNKKIKEPTFNMELSKYKSMICPNSKFSNPPFCRWKGGGVNDKGLCLWVIFSRSFKALNIWTMSKFSLAVTSNNLIAINTRKPFLFLGKVQKEVFSWIKLTNENIWVKRMGGGNYIIHQFLDTWE